MQGVESGKRYCRKSIRTTHDEHIRNTCSDKLTCISHADASRCAGISHIRDNSARTYAICHMVCYGGNGHLSDVFGLFSVHNIILDAHHSAYAASHYHTESAGVNL